MPLSDFLFLWERKYNSYEYRLQATSAMQNNSAATCRLVAFVACNYLIVIIVAPKPYSWKEAS